MYQELEADFKQKFSIEKWNKLDVVLNKLLDSDFEDMEENGFDISCSKEKVNQLQENICVDIYFEENEIQLMFENGINNGTQLNDYSLSDDSNLSDIERHHDVIVDVVVDYKKMDLLGINYSKEKAEIMLSNNKSNLLKLAKNQNYDNYVTGGGTNKTDSYYKSEKEKLNNKGLYWIYITKTVTVKADFN